MYKINKENCNKLRGMKNGYYASRLGVTGQTISNIFNGSGCSELLARGILSVYFNIGLNDEDLDKLLEDYFINTKEEE